MANTKRCATRTFLCVLTIYFLPSGTLGWQLSRIAHCAQPQPHPPLPARFARIREMTMATQTAAMIATVKSVPQFCESQSIIFRSPLPSHVFGVFDKDGTSNNRIPPKATKQQSHRSRYPYPSSAYRTDRR